ncbi:MAG: hypothetical protein C0594_05220 [Marinilabiliales bacterium]|nr:MAG: hypothetical protein C0594_05220 [Marinilabiliales bacterium]
MQSPAINCSSLSSVVLSFWRYANLETNYDEAYVKISTDGTNWTDLGEPLYPTDDYWVQRIIDISQYADGESTVYIRWISESDNYTTYSGWNIDDVTITGVQSGGSCVSTEVQSTTVYASPSSSFTVTDPECSYDNAIVEYTGTATTGASYNWNFDGGTVVSGSGQGPVSIDFSSPGTYSVSLDVTENGCSSSVSNQSVVVPSNLSLTMTKNDANCGNADCSASVSVSGGTSPYTYVWSGGQTTSSISSLPAGTYTVTVTDANFCAGSESVDIGNVGGPTVNTTVNADVTCYGGSDGTASVSASGGVSPYTYNWSTGAESTTITGLSAGTYYVTVEASNGCASSTSVSITQPSAISAVATASDVVCNGQTNGTVQLEVNGGTSPYYFSWSNGATTEDLTNVGADTYSVDITDAAGCSAFAWAQVQQPSAIVFNETVNDINCNGDNTGSVVLSVSGGTSPYSYSWSGGQTTSSLSSLTANTYQVTVSDANSCSQTGSFTLNEPSQINISYTVDGVTCYGDNDGEVSISVSGGISGYSYNWSTGASSQNITALDGGTYFVTVTDGNSCQEIQGVTVSEPGLLSGSTNVDNVTCYGESDGSIDLTATGGTPSYSYAWTGPNGYNGSPADGDLSALEAGSYQVVITDSHGCTGSVSATLSQPAQISITTNAVNSSCGSSDGSVSVDNVTGGSGSYTYSWSAPGGTGTTLANLSTGTYTVTVTDANGCMNTANANVSNTNGPTVSVSNSSDVTCNGGSNGTASVTATGGTSPYSYIWSPSGGTDATASGLSAGTYSVIVTDDNSCSASAFVDIIEPSAINISINATDVACNGNEDGQIQMSVNGGTQPYTYSWNSGQTNEDIQNLTGGTYEVTVTDNNSCTATASEIISEPNALALSFNIVDANCNKNDGMANVVLTGGQTPYSYIWSSPGGTTQTLENIGEGTYTVTVTDANGCINTGDAVVDQTDAATVVLTVSDVSCYGNTDGEIATSVNGGTSPYTYNWSSGETTANLSNISGGSYTVTVTDANSCETIESASVEESAAVELTASTSDVSCYGENDGAINVSVSGGTYPYDYEWNNGSSIQDLNDLSEGTYEVTVSDANVCTASLSIYVNEPGEITVSVVSVNVSCNGNADGAVNITVSGGTPSYAYQWSNGISTEDISSVDGGNYSVTITDASGCTTTEDAIVDEAAALMTNVVVTSTTSTDASDGSVDLQIVGGVSPYTYLWSNFETTEDLNNISMETYYVTVADADGCLAVDSAIVPGPDSLLGIYNQSIVHVLCHGDLTGAIDITAGGGLAPYSFEWSNGSNEEDLENIAAGSYSVTITDQNAVEYTESFTILEPDQLEVTGVELMNPGCDKGEDGYIAVSVSGGQEPIDYLWDTDPEQTDSIVVDIPAGTYYLTITDANECVYVFDTSLVAGEGICLEIPNVFTPNNDSKNDLWIIKGIEHYPEAEVAIFNRWGAEMYRTSNYAQEPWDGTYKGKELPISSYVYIIKLNSEGSPDPEPGVVSIVR